MGRKVWSVAVATYKVIQDIEAEDKFVGPLTLKQFIFGAIGAFFAYLSFFALSQGLPYALIILAPPMLLGFFLAIPWSKDQSTEVWVLAKLRFALKPRKRIWDQSGMEELVTITAPKKIEKQLTDNLSQTEVKSRLSALAQTIDTRGWAVKDLQQNNPYQLIQQDQDERLVSVATLPQTQQIMNTDEITDMYSTQTQASQNFDQMIKQNTQMHRTQSVETMNQVRTGKTPPVRQPAIQAPSASSAPDDKLLSEELKKRKQPNDLATSHMRKLNPSSKSKPKTHHKKHHDNKAETPKDNVPKQPSDPKHEAVIMEYANNNDLNIATIARQAEKETKSDNDEVVISLH